MSNQLLIDRAGPATRNTSFSGAAVISGQDRSLI